MPESDDVPRLAEIARTLSDFRSEFRDAIGGMVRRDVYTAEMRTLEVRIENQALELKRIESDNNAELKRIDNEIDKDRNYRKSLQTQVFGAGLTALVSLALLVVQVVVK